ncbi:MAG: PilZ domain-containing protein [Phycisphaerae bacterium]|nr:PilZ domain-containing protein [Phycisphaerae bacterium]
MSTQEIVNLTQKRITEIVVARQEAGLLPSELVPVERRHGDRWPFRGAVELWPEGMDGRSLTHGTCLNIGDSGMGLCCDEYHAPGETMEVAIHLPEMTLCGQAVVRYCSQVRNQFMVGMEFIYD